MRVPEVRIKVGRKVREAYMDLSLDKLDVPLGKQIIAWGRADKLNPTNNLKPRDYTLQVIDAEEQRLGATAAMFHYPLQGNDLVLTGVWMPRISRNYRSDQSPAWNCIL